MDSNFSLLAETGSAGFWPHSLADNWLAIAAGFGAVYAFFHALRQYKEGQLWLKMRFLGEEFAKFRADPKVSTAFVLLDEYDERELVLFPAAQKANERIKTITTQQVIMALAEKDKYETEDARICDAIRDCFDTFFDGLERLECFISSGLIEAKRLEPLLAYWVWQFADEKRTKRGPDFVRAARSYVEKWYPGEVQCLCHRFGCGFGKDDPTS